MKSGVDNAREQADGSILLPDIAIDLGAVSKVSVPVSKVRAGELAGYFRGTA